MKTLPTCDECFNHQSRRREALIDAFLTDNFEKGKSKKIVIEGNDPAEDPINLPLKEGVDARCDEGVNGKKGGRRLKTKSRRIWQ